MAVVALTSCINRTTTKESDSQSCCTGHATTKSCESGSVEVLYMHGKQRCVTCVAIGKEAEAVVGEFAGSDVVMRTIDFSTPEGEAIADRYEIASSSLIVVKGSEVKNLTAAGFKYARNNPEQFRAQLKEAIQKMAE